MASNTNEPELEAEQADEARGYTIQFVEAPSSEFYCTSCGHVAKDLSIAVCCGQHYCYTCIVRYRDASKPCPGCGRELGSSSVVPHERYRKSILALEVHCLQKGRGCAWRGALGGLDAHLDVASEDCQFVDVACPNDCSEPVPRCELADHLQNSCSKRDFDCIYCGFSGSYEVVCSEHYPVCDLLPIPCPNGCYVVSIEQGTLSEHLAMCLYQEVECDVMGCGQRMTREKMKVHMESNQQEHVTLMASGMRNITQRLEEQKHYFEEREKEMQAGLEERDHKIQSLQTKLEDKQKESELIFTLHMQLQAGEAPFHFTVPRIAQKTEASENWFSPLMYVCKGGPKISLIVYPNGRAATSAHCSHVSVALAAVKGECDGQMKWPVRCSVTVQLINQHADSGHVTVQRGFHWERPTGQKSLGFFGKVCEYEFIPHSCLEWNAKRQTQFLKGNCLKFAVQHIVLHSEKLTTHTATNL